MSDQSRRIFVSYIDKSREYYLHKGYGNPYRWAFHAAVPFAKLRKPLNQCRVGLVTTVALDEAGGIDRQVYAAPTQPKPEALYTNHLSWHKKVTHTDDVDSFLPITHLEEAVKNGRISSLSPRFYGVPTKFSQRLTNEEHAPLILEHCQADEVDVAFLLPM